MKRYKLKNNVLDIDDAAMKGKLAYHFFNALYPGQNYENASADIKMIMKGLTEIAYEQLEKHMIEPKSETTVTANT